MMCRLKSIFRTLLVIVPLWMISMLVFHSVRPTLQGTVNSNFQRYGDLLFRWRINETRNATDAQPLTDFTANEPTVNEPTLKERTVNEPTLKEPTVKEPTVTEPTVTGPTEVATNWSDLTRQNRTGCSCNATTEYHLISLDEFKSTFSQLNVSRPDFFNTNYVKDNYTIVIPSYKRDNAIPVLLNHFCNASHVHMILFVWQNIERPVPEEFFNYTCRIPFKFILPKKNILSNRFKLYSEIETEAVLSVDDDSYLKYKALNTGFEVLRSYPHLMVGFVSRTHSVKNGHYRYAFHKNNPCYSIILTGVVFLHRRYLEMYSSPDVERLRNFVDTQMNGEDIVMNGIVSNYQNRAGINLTPTCHGIQIQGDRVEIKIPGAEYPGLFRRPSHYQKRHDCLALITHFFGELPLTCCHYEVKNSHG